MLFRSIFANNLMERRYDYDKQLKENKVNNACFGLGGFAIFWFVIKKKSFADLIAAIKGIFKKKQ